MRRVVITGLGVVSCIGNDLDTVENNLRNGRSGVRFVDEYSALGLRSCVAGIPDLSAEPPIDRKHRRFMGDASIYAHHALRKALADAGLQSEHVSHPRIGLIVGSGVGSPFQHIAAVDILRSKGLSRVPPYTVPQVMGNTTSACLATAFRIQGHSYSLASACATSSHCIGHAMDLIRYGKQDMVFAGGAEEVCWTSTVLFDAMGALSTGHNDRPESASRPYDRGRDGFVVAGGAGMLVLEAEEHARARGARIYAELKGYGACSDGQDMVTPSAEGAARVMRLALQQANCHVSYINTHATSTPVGDLSELAAIREVFETDIPLVSSTKGLTGHAIAASGAQEAVFSLLMLDRRFVAANANLSDPDPGTGGMPLVTSCLSQKLDAVMSNSFGFGGTNASLVFGRYPSVSA